MSADEFLDRVMPHVASLNPDRFSHTSWRFEGRPTSETVGVLPNPETDVELMVQHILDVEAYPDNVKYVESVESSNGGRTPT